MGTWKLRVDLTGSRLGPEWHSVELTLEPSGEWTTEMMREGAAEHYGVPLSQVGEPWPDAPSYIHDGDCGSTGEDLPATLVGLQREIDRDLEDRWLTRTDELLAADPAVALHDRDNAGPYSPVTCPLCRRLHEINVQAARDVGALPAGAAS